jgi:hypothetical protein
MNNRLLELATEADLIRYPSDSINIKIEKFAELIIRECASKVTRNEALNILEHFGVEA